MQEIHSNVPMPGSRGAAKFAKNSKYPWRKLQIGQSFMFPEEMPEHHARSYASSTGKRLGLKFSVRRVDGGLMCWRVS